MIANQSAGIQFFIFLPEQSAFVNPGLQLHDPLTQMPWFEQDMSTTLFSMSLVQLKTGFN